LTPVPGLADHAAIEKKGVRNGVAGNGTRGGEARRIGVVLPVRVSATADRLGFSLDERAKAPVIWAALLAGAALAWTATVRGALEMGNGPGTMGLGPAGFMLLWLEMMAAMMLPSVAPVGSLYLRSVRSRSTGVRRTLRVGGVIAGYLGAWAALGLLAFPAAWAAGRLATEAPGAARWVGGATLGAAGLHQLTPLKDRCLTHCRSPLGFLLRFGAYSGRLRDVRVGLYHGGYCLGCCWAFFAVLIAVGVMNLAWMGGLAVVIFLEKTWRFGRPLGIAFGIVLLAVAFFVPAHPELVPGLHHGRDGGTMGMTP
jgi:predicted metal-binding membrane protein